MTPGSNGAVLTGSGPLVVHAGRAEPGQAARGLYGHTTQGNSACRPQETRWETAPPGGRGQVQPPHATSPLSAELTSGTDAQSR